MFYAVVEFLDTLLLLVRGREVSFLHGFHHLTTFVICYVGLESGTTYSWTAMLSNCSVHTVMYFYYAAAAWTGQRFGWARLLTAVQMGQFLVNLGLLGVWAILRLSGTANCAGDWTGLTVCVFAMMAYFALFKRMAMAKHHRSDRTNNNKTS